MGQVAEIVAPLRTYLPSGPGQDCASKDQSLNYTDQLKGSPFALYHWKVLLSYH